MNAKILALSIPIVLLVCLVQGKFPRMCVCAIAPSAPVRVRIYDRVYLL